MKYVMIVLFFVSVNVLGKESQVATNHLSKPVQMFFQSIEKTDLNQFENLIEEDSVIEDWGKVIKGKAAIVEFSSDHLIGVKAQFAINHVEMTEDGELVDGLWTSEAFTGPTRFIFTLNADKTKFSKLNITSPRWFDRLFIAIKSIFS